MTVHISVRLSWHNDGWNGRICQEPHKNPYCVGQHSYPGDLIATSRDLDWERESCGKECLELYEKEGLIPPCSFSINAYGDQEIFVKADPPEFFRDGTETKIWRTETPGFSKRNHNFYVNKCGFKIIRIDNPGDFMKESYFMEKEM